MTARRLADQVGILTLGNAAALAVQLLLGIFLARALAREAFASYLQVTMLVATLSPILFLGLPSSLYYFLPRYADERRDRLLLASVVLLLLLGAAGAGAVALLAEPLSAGLNNPDLAPAVRRYGLALVGMLPAAVAHPLLVSLERYRSATLLVAGIALAEAATTASAVLLGARLETLALALALTHVAAGALVLALVARVARVREGLRGLGDRALLRELLGYAVPFATSIHVGTLNRFLDRYIIGAVYPPAAFAVYAVGARQVPVLPLVVSSINVVLQQRFTALHREGRTGEIVPTWRAAMRKQALLVLPLGVALWLLAEPFVTGLYSDRYRESVPIFRIYLGILALRVATWPLVLTGLGRTRTLLAGSLLALLASAVVSVALIRPLGLLGPAVGAVVGPAVAAAYYLRGTGRVLNVPWARLVPWSVLLRVAGAAAGAALLLAPFAARAEGLLEAAPVAIAYGLLFAALAGLLGVLRREDLAFLRDWLRLAAAAGAGRQRQPEPPAARRNGRPVSL